MSRIVILALSFGIFLEIFFCIRKMEIPKLIVAFFFTFVFAFVRMGKLESLNIVSFALIWLIYFISLIASKKSN